MKGMLSIEVYMTKPDITGLLQAFAEKADPKIFDQLLPHIQGRLYRICFHILGSKEDAEDAFQEVMLKIFHLVKKFKGGNQAQCEAWLAKIAVYVSLDYRRSKAIQKRMERKVSPMESQDQPDTTLENTELYKAIRQSLIKIPSSQRVALVLGIMEGFTQHEIAKILGRSQSFVLRELQKGLKNVRLLLNSSGFALAPAVLTETLKTASVNVTIPVALQAATTGSLVAGKAGAAAKGATTSKTVSTASFLAKAKGVALAAALGGAAVVGVTQVMMPQEPLAVTPEPAARILPAAPIDSYKDGVLAKAIKAGGNAWHISVADVNGDGRNEMIYACYDGQVYCQDKVTEQILWHFDTKAFPYDLNTGDLDGDKKSEVLVGSADGHIYVINSNGSLKWKFKSPAPIYQVNVAKTKEGSFVVAGGVDKKIYILDAAGKVKKTLPQPVLVRILRTGDVNGDGQDDIIFSDIHGKTVKAYQAPDWNKIWQSKLKTRTKRGAFEARLNYGKLWYPYGLALRDVNGDKKSELLFSSYWKNNNSIILMNPDGTEVFETSEGLYDRARDFPYPSGLMDVCTYQGKKTLVVKNPRSLMFFDPKDGTQLESVTAYKVAFTDFCVDKAPDGTTEILLASAPNGDDQIYRVLLKDGWQKAFSELGRQGKMLKVEQNIEKIRQQIRTYKGKPKKGRTYVHNVAVGQAFQDESYKRVHPYRAVLPYENIRLAMILNVYSNKVWTEYQPSMAGMKKKYAEWWPGKLAKSMAKNANQPRARDPKVLPQLLKKNYEDRKVYFYCGLAHGCVPYYTPEVAEAIMKACPKYCLGFAVYESKWGSAFGTRLLSHYFQELVLPVMEACKKFNKKLIMVEKSAFWVTVPAQEEFKKYFGGAYANVLVPSVEDSTTRSAELNLAGRFGLLYSGCVNEFESRSCIDEQGWDRNWEFQFFNTGHPFLRRQMIAGLLGATRFNPSSMPHRKTVKPKLFKGPFPEGVQKLRFSNVTSESQELMLHMLGKGILIPPKPREMLNVSSCRISILNPTEAFIRNACGFGMVWGDQEDLDSPFEGLAAFRGQVPVRENYIGHYLFMQNRHAYHFLPATPYGFPVIVPDFAKRKYRVRKTWKTDGSYFYEKTKDGLKKLSGVEARPKVLASFQKASKKLPYRAEGYVFMQAQRIDKFTDRITLVDSGYVDPADRQVTLFIQDKRQITEIYDLLSGERFNPKKRKIKPKRPAKFNSADRVVESSTLGTKTLA